MARVLVGVIRMYQMTLSPFLGANCRFTPSCSQYAIDALAKHGALRGTWYACGRIVRCQPFCEGGWDPIP